MTKIKKYYRIPDGNDGRGRPIGASIAEVLPDGKIALGFSLCSKSDMVLFDPQKCNLIAEGRLKSRKFVVDNVETIPYVVDEAFFELYPDLVWVAKEALHKFNKGKVTTNE